MHGDAPGLSGILQSRYEFIESAFMKALSSNINADN
jgi:hypothetical protein